MRRCEAAIVGAGLAGLSAAIYLARALRDVVVMDAGNSMAVLEPDVQNYLGFPEGISGSDLLRRGSVQATQFGAEYVAETITGLSPAEGGFALQGRAGAFEARRVLLATGLTHLPPEIAGARECVGTSLFFCKDCDAYRVRGRRVALIGWGDEAARYALGLLALTSHVAIATNGRPPSWNARYDAALREYGIPVYPERLMDCIHDKGRITGLRAAGGAILTVQVAFVTRSDVLHAELARQVGAALDAEGQVQVDADMRTSVPGLFAAGCVTPASCQMVIAAGQGATAARAIDRELFEEDLDRHALKRYVEVPAAAPLPRRRP